MREGYQRAMSRQKDRVMIYGAGSAGRQLAQALANGDEFHPVMFIDDDSGLQNTSVLGLKVTGPEGIANAVRELMFSAFYWPCPARYARVAAKFWIARTVAGKSTNRAGYV